MTIRRTRRTVLKAGLPFCSATIGAGCSAPLTQSEDPAFDLEATVIQSAIPYTQFDYYVIEDPGQGAVQFLLCDVSGTGEPADVGRFTLITSKKDYSPRRFETGAEGVVIAGEYQEPYPEEGNAGWIAFSLPRLATDKATLQFRHTERTLPQNVVDRLATAPSFDVGQTHLNDGCVTLAVRNTGDTDGTFYFTLDNGKEGKWARQSVDVGEKVSVTECIQTDGDGVTVRWSGGDTHLEEG